MSEWLHAIINTIVEVVGAWGYPGIVIMMALESSFFPFPSEVVMIPAGYHAHQGQMNMAAVIACGIFGSLIGAWFNYYISLALGRPALLKFGRYFLIKPEKFAMVDRLFERHGEIITFIGRLVPAVRQLISCPAGLARMNIARFTFYTGLGAGLWVVVLAAFGWHIGNNIDFFKAHQWEIAGGLMAFCALVVAVYVWRQKRRSPAAGNAPDDIEPAER